MHKEIRKNKATILIIEIILKSNQKNYIVFNIHTINCMFKLKKNQIKIQKL